MGPQRPNPVGVYWTNPLINLVVYEVAEPSNLVGVCWRLI